MTLEHSKHGAIWLGIDLGTQSVRAMAVTETGEVVGRGTHLLSSRRDAPRHEQDPEGWWHALVIACRAALVDLTSSQICGLAVDGTSGTILLADESDRPLSAALMYDDGRALDEARRVNEAGATVWASLGYRMQASWGLPKLLWLLDAHPEISKGAHLLHQTDFINRRLAGRALPSDSSNALKTGYDLIHERWPSKVLEELRVPESVMPAVVRPGTRIGTVCREAAVPTGIPEGTPIFAGMTDSCAAQIAAGALEVGSWNSVLGTTLVLRGVTKGLLHDPAGTLYSHRSPDGPWLPGGASSTGAGILAKRFPNRDLDMLSTQAAAYEPASVIAYPLASRGERFPFAQPEAEGFFLGQPKNEGDFFAAILQGVAFVERLAFDYLDSLGAPVAGEVSLTGGATRNRSWCQLRADILERSLRLPENAEAALGMAVLAASGGRPLAQVARQMVRIREVIDPSPKAGARFREAYLCLVEEFTRRGWLQPALADHAKRRAT